MKTIGVIGMGPAGLAVVKELKEAGFTVKGFDRNARVGGRWSLEEGVGGVYKELYVNISRRNMGYSDFPWENFEGDEAAYAGLFPHNTEVATYLQAYAEHNQLLPDIQLNTQVTKISEEKGTWTVITTEAGSKDGKETEHLFDAVVLCSGLFSKPNHPLKDFFKSYTGVVKHSAEVRSVKDYKDQRVLVIGSDISGSDMCCSLVSHGNCARVVSSVRKAPYYTHKISPVTLQTVDEVLGIRLPAWLTRILPNSFALMGLKTAILQAWPKQPGKELTAGLEQPADLGVSGFSLTADFVDQVETGKVEMKPGLASAEGKKVTFNDGSSEEFDAVVCATGYRVDLSYLPQAIQEKVGHTNPFSGAKSVKLYKQTLVPGMDNIAFAGYFHNAGGHFPMAEMQARYIAATFSGKVPRPSDSTLQAGADAVEATRAACPFSQYDSTAAICESIGDELGVTPSKWQALKSPKKLLFSPVYPCYYRTNPAVEGEEKAARFSKIFEDFLANPAKPIF